MQEISNNGTHHEGVDTKVYPTQADRYTPDQSKCYCWQKTQLKCKVQGYLVIMKSSKIIFKLTSYLL